jgi:hypothetical protein
VVAVKSEILAALDVLAVTGWRREIALALATQLDSEPNASVARELRILMQEIGAAEVPKESSLVDDLKARRERRRFKPTGS